MALSKTFLCALVLITVAVQQIESRECYYLSNLSLKCQKYCCGKGPFNYQCKDDCEGIACDSDDDCGSGCCRDDQCGDCPLSTTIIAIIVGCAVVFLIIIIVVAICCCNCCQSQSRQDWQVVVGRWAELHNANNLRVANPAVNVVHTSSNVYMQH